MKKSASNHLFLYRSYTDSGVFAQIQTSPRTHNSLELHWLNKRILVSCIPEGPYPLASRRSGVVERSTGGQYRLTVITKPDGSTWH